MSNKTIKINPIFFHNNKKTKKKQSKISNISNNNINSNKIKSSFIKKIKEYKKSKKQNNNSNNPNQEKNTESNDFNDSIQFVKSILRENKEKKEKKKKFKNPMINTQSFDKLINNNSYSPNTIDPYIQTSSIPPPSLPPPSLPPPSLPPPSLPPPSLPPQIPRLNEDMSFFSQNEKYINKRINKPLKKNKTIKLGKIGKKKIISILIPSKNEKIKIENYKKTLKNNSIQKIKKFLKNKGLIKIGCIAPKNILREMYESVKLTGDVYNNSKDYLIHNFVNID